jgi:hypothetical protein
VRYRPSTAETKPAEWRLPIADRPAFDRTLEDPGTPV